MDYGITYRPDDNEINISHLNCNVSLKISKERALFSKKNYFAVQIFGGYRDICTTIATFDHFDDAKKFMHNLATFIDSELQSH